MDIKRKLENWALVKPLFLNHMSFIIGPRQAGKTTLVKNYLKAMYNDTKTYFNWDSEKTIRLFNQNPYFFEFLQKPKEKILIAFDEIHKRRKWKKYLKGVFDSFNDIFRFVISGSGRLDLFQKGGDSLAGRYDPYFLFPFTPGELENLSPNKKLSIDRLLEIKDLKESLIKDWENLGPFPEPFLSSSEAKAKRWWQQYKIRVTEEDIKDITKLESLDLIKDLLVILPSTVGSPLSINSLREDLNCAHSTMARYIKTLNLVFFTFEIPPYSKNLKKIIKKEKKLYFFNFITIKDEGAKFENMVALLLLKWCSAFNEQAWGNVNLYYLRDQSRREVDFLIVKDDKPFALIESKQSALKFNASSLYYQRLFNIPIIQIVRSKDIAIRKKEGIIISIHKLAAFAG